MNEDERYLFDLNGYLLLRGVLTPEEVAELNSGIDHHSEEMTAIDRSLAGESGALSGTSRRKDLGGMLAWERPYCEPFRRLLVHLGIGLGRLGQQFLDMASVLRDRIGDELDRRRELDTGLLAHLAADHPGRRSQRRCRGLLLLDIAVDGVEDRCFA